MRKLLSGVLVVLSLCASSCGVAGNVGSGGDARYAQVGEYQCSTSEPLQCECERTAIGSGLTPQQARVECAR